MKLSTNYITFASLGLVLAFITMSVGQVIDCEIVEGAKSLTTCGNGEPVSFYWKAISLLIAASGVYVWISKNNPASEKETRE